MESPRLSVTRSTTAEGIAVLALRGEIDFTTGTEVQRALLGPDGEAAARTVVELSQVTFMDSSGINALIGAHQAATALQGWVRLAAPSPRYGASCRSSASTPSSPAIPRSSRRWAWGPGAAGQARTVTGGPTVQRVTEVRAYGDFAP